MERGVGKGGRRRGKESTITIFYSLLRIVSEEDFYRFLIILFIYLFYLCNTHSAKSGITVGGIYIQKGKNVQCQSDLCSTTDGSFKQHINLINHTKK